MRLTKISKGKGMWAYTTFSMIRNFLNYLLTLIHFKHLSNCPQTWHSLPPSVHSLLFSPFLALYFSLSIFLCLSSSLLFFLKYLLFYFSQVHIFRHLAHSSKKCSAFPGLTYLRKEQRIINIIFFFISILPFEEIVPLTMKSHGLLNSEITLYWLQLHLFPNRVLAPIFGGKYTVILK